MTPYKINEKAIKSFQEIYKKEYNKDLSYEEASEQAHNLIRFAESLMDMHIRDEKRKHRLKSEPKGFLLDGVGYSCFICGGSTRENEAWYDKYGIKCITCQKGIDKKQIPASMAKNKNAWYSMYDLESRFNLKSPTIRKWIRDGILKSRAIADEKGRTHVQIFLIKDNKGFLPPKKMTESRSVQEEIDGKTWTRSEPWYKFVDPKEYLKEYEIMNYLKVVHLDKKES